jgi:3'-phosphoadenosine 5'-phosphosulfate (PAPS) 3'-phosphatase
VDKGVEKMVSTRLSEKFPTVAFMGEETYKPGTRVGPEPTFIVDPIDGMSWVLRAETGHRRGFYPGALPADLQ